VKKKCTFIVFLLLLCFCDAVQVFASRANAPAEIPPIIYNDIRIVAENSSPENMGIVQAFDVNTKKLIWSTKVYKVKIKRNIEDDTQWIFISEMKIVGDKLVIVNEKKEIYNLDPNTGKDLSKDHSIRNYVIIFISIAICTAVIILIISMIRKKSIR
jgi:outer membrane protein assembly factor BamB